MSQQSGDITTAEIYTMAANGSDPRRLTEADRGCFQPRSSPDGGRILFRLGWKHTHSGLFTVNTEGERQLTQIR